MHQPHNLRVIRHTSFAARIGGFTLLELLVVLVIVGVMLGMVSMSALPNKRQALQSDAQRVALLLQMAREEAIVRNRRVAFELDAERYRFYVKSDTNEWLLIDDNDFFRERSFKNAPLVIGMQPGSTPAILPLKVVFGREPVDRPFKLTLSLDDATVAIMADGLGHFEVQ